MTKILVTGSNGQLGSELREIAQDYPDINFLFTDIEELDLTDNNQLEKMFSENKFNFCINCAAYTAVDRAEDEPEKAMLVNHESVKNLTIACNAADTLLIHISTDYVFDGTNHKPYNEDDVVAPNSVYGNSKLLGELAVTTNSQKCIIIRTSWLYSEYGNNFVKTMLRLGEEREVLGVVADQVGTPTYAADLALAIMNIIEEIDGFSGKEIYHYSNEGAISWYDFAKAIMDYAELDCEINAIESKDFPAKANRPFYSVLSKEKIKNDFNITIPYWLDSLKVMMDNL